MQNEPFSFVRNEDARNSLMRSYDRIRRSYDELLSGYNQSAEDVLNDVVHVSSYKGTVSVQNIHFYSICEHHFAPFFGTATVIYQPSTIITGLGKLVRLVRDVHGKRLQIQELMTKNIAEDIMRVLDAKGVYVVTNATHLCMCSRGPKDDGSCTTVQYGIGTLESLALAARK